MLERKHLKMIQTIADYGTVTKAAEVMFLSQSALSHMMKKLEKQLRVEIWQREGRTLKLTRAGERLYQFALTTLPQFKYIEEELEHYARGKSGLLRLGTECHPCYQWLLMIVEPYLECWPMVDMNVKQQFQSKGAEALLNYEVDILITPDPVQLTGLIFIPVFQYELVLAVSKRHHLANAKIVQASDLRNETLITYPVPAERLDIFQKFLWRENVHIAQHKTLEDTEIILQMVVANRGVTALPRWLLIQKNINVHLLRLGSNGIFKHIHLGIRESDSNLDYIKGFIELAREKSK